MELLGVSNWTNNAKNIIMAEMKDHIIHRAETRGHANHGWLDTHHTFSFANYYNPERVHFGMLRVLNDDIVDAGKGFGTHPHDNMEIISIPLEGDLEHRDSMGNVAVIRKGEIQVMSAGTGITHSEYNKNDDRPVKFLQIWVFPREQHLKPRYDQIKLDANKMRNAFQQIVSPDPSDEGAWISQDAWFSLGDLEQGKELEYKLKNKADGVYAFIIRGEATVDGIKLNERDGMGITGAESFKVEADTDAEILLMEVPMF